MKKLLVLLLAIGIAAFGNIWLVYHGAIKVIRP
jgi:hypothetical protein